MSMKIKRVANVIGKEQKKSTPGNASSKKSPSLKGDSPKKALWKKAAGKTKRS